jgi:hypothetical protein
VTLLLPPPQAKNESDSARASASQMIFSKFYVLISSWCNGKQYNLCAKIGEENGYRFMPTFLS